jgi:quinol monooxygenase YgiN
MSENVLGITVVQIKPGQLDNFRAVVKDLVAATRANEPGAMAYEYFVSPDGTTCHIYERYVDSAAVMAHLANFSQFAEQFMAAVEMTGVTLYGDPSDELREAVSGLNPVILQPMDGFAR